VADAGFREAIVLEAAHQLKLLRRHACIAAYCGGSEVAQQAAMMGLPAEQWSNDFFDDTLRQMCAEASPGVPYFPSTPWGGALPFHVGTGIAHYYGVGAYRRPLADVKTARVRFTPECLGFSNVPDRPTMDLVMDGATPPPHHPRWKARVPRDGGAGWDFEDIRDHYLRVLFDRDPVALRSEDLDSYYAISRVVTGEVMRRVFAEWRAPQSGCGGALVWFLRDLLPGAGWGLIDSTGRPKAAYWYLKRAWAPRSIHLTDEGLDGLAIHVTNDSAAPLAASVEIETYRHGRHVVASATMAVEVRAHGAISLGADALIGRFTDATHAYRFGPPKQDVVAVRLVESASGAILSEDFHFPVGLDLPLQHGEPTCEVAAESDGNVVVTVKSDVFLQAVSLGCKGWLPDDDYFHVVPGRPKRIVFAPAGPAAPFRAELAALNATEVVSLRLQSPG
jgi:beta-mannosidase